MDHFLLDEKNCTLQLSHYFIIKTIYSLHLLFLIRFRILFKDNDTLYSCLTIIYVFFLTKQYNTLYYKINLLNKALIMKSLPFDTYQEVIKKTSSINRCGIIKESRGLLIESKGPQASIGEICTIDLGKMHHVLAEVVGFRDKHLLLMPLGDLDGVAPGMKTTATGMPYMVNVGTGLLGRVLNGFGNPIDSRGPVDVTASLPLTGEKINPLVRNRITDPLWTQIRAIDGVVTIGKGQRIGIFSGSGVGKSILLGMIARRIIADVNVIALIGERGREVREFLENDLGEEGLKHYISHGIHLTYYLYNSHTFY